MYLADMLLYDRGPLEDPTHLYGFVVSCDGMDFEIFPYTDKDTRDDAFEQPMIWGFSMADAIRFGALISAWLETDNEKYYNEAEPYLIDYGWPHESIWDQYLDTLQSNIWEVPYER